MTWNITHWLFVRKILVTRCNDADYVSLNMERAEDEDEDDEEEELERHLNELADVEDIGVCRGSLQEAQRKRKRKKRRKKKTEIDGRMRRGGGGLEPEDLPKRARWTIIATACLLLLMSVLLVGVTLRMAPVIDEMGESHHVYFLVFIFITGFIICKRSAFTDTDRVFLSSFSYSRRILPTPHPIHISKHLFYLYSGAVSSFRVFNTRRVLHVLQRNPSVRKAFLNSFVRKYYAETFRHFFLQI